MVIFQVGDNSPFLDVLKSTTLLLVYVLMCPWALFAQISGTVVDAASNEPIALVNIMVIGTSIGYVTDVDGKFDIKGKSMPLELRFSAVGYETLLLPFSVSKQDIRVTLTPVRITGTEVLVRSGRIITGLENKNPIPVTTITYDELQLKQNSTAADLLRAETGVYVQQTTPGQGSIYVRGRAGRDVLYLFNGLRMNPSFVRSGQNQYFGSIDPFGVDQIDVFRGPISTFYGSDALSGGVNVVPRIASLSSMPNWTGRLQTQLNIGGNGEKTIHGEIGRSSQKLAASISGTFRDFSYYSMSPSSDPALYFPYGRTLRESAFSYHAIQGSTRWVASDRTSFEAVFFRSVIPDAPRWDRMIVGFSGSDSPARYYDSNTSPLAFTAAQVEILHQSWRPWVNNIRIHAGYHQLMDFRKSVRFSTLPSQFFDRYTSMPSDVETHDNNTSDQYHLSADLKTLLSKSTLLTWGADFSYDHTRSEQYQHSHNSGVNQMLLSRFPNGSEYVQTGFFAHVYHDGIDRWTLEGGLRFSSSYAKLPMEGVRSARTFDPYSQWFSQITGSAGASYKLADNTYVVGNIGTGFRAPNVADLSEVGIRRSDLYQTANPELKPEQSANLDLGVRLSTTNLKAEISGFMIHYFDKIDVHYTGEVVDQLGRRVIDGRVPGAGNELYYESVSANASSMNLVGLESEIQYAGIEGIKTGLITNYTYGRVRNADGIRDYVDRIPPANGLFYFEVSALDNSIRIRPQARFAFAKRKLAAEEIADSRISPEGTDGFVNLQLISTVDINRSLQFRVFVDNLSNAAYREHASTLDGMQRNITMSLNYAF
jgi:outer membrane receptor protein involved in Fe transport